jgi:hypothetical protein
MRRCWSPTVLVFVVFGCGGQAMTGGRGSSGASMGGNRAGNAALGRAGSDGGSSPGGSGSGHAGSGTSSGGRGSSGRVSDGGEAALGGSGPSVCCEAVPTCDEGERPDTRASACGTPCREVALCCETIHCCPASSCPLAAENPNGPGGECGLACDPSDVQLSACPPDVTCTQISNCGMTAFCAPAGAIDSP